MRLNTGRARALLRRRGLTADEIDRWIALHIRCDFARAYLKDREGHPWRVRPYQMDSFESYAFRKVHCDGRDVGKTTEIELIAAWASVARPDTEMLIATQCENHLYPLMDRVCRRIQSTPDLAGCLTEVKRSPSWHLRFSNGFVLWGRIAGPRGVNFQGLHVDWQIVDEAQEMTETAWGELYQALNDGGRRWVYGVPNGLRNTFYRMTQMQDAEQYNWPSSFNPQFTAEKDAELALLYGARTRPGISTGCWAGTAHPPTPCFSSMTTSPVSEKDSMSSWWRSARKTSSSVRPFREGTTTWGATSDMRATHPSLSCSARSGRTWSTWPGCVCRGFPMRVSRK